MLFVNEFQKIIAKNRLKKVLYIGSSADKLYEMLKDSCKCSCNLKRNHKHIFNIFKNEKEIVTFIFLNKDSYTAEHCVRGQVSDYVFVESYIPEELHRGVLALAMDNEKIKFISNGPLHVMKNKEKITIDKVFKFTYFKNKKGIHTYEYKKGD